VRDRFLKALVLSGISAALITESLSVFHWIGRPALIVAWGLILVAFAWWSARNPLTRSSHPIRPLEATITACIAAIIALLALTAWLSPPNTFDALAYHMPRVVYWTQSGSVAFFPSPYLSQISAPPLDEYLKLHVYVLAGGDRLVNLVSVAAFAACVVGASAIAGELGLNSKGQAFAAILCATLPSGVLQASGPKNDCLTALWLVCLVYFAIRTRPAFLGLSLGLALATKGTAYLFAPPLLAGALWIAARQKRRALPWLPCALWVVSGVLLANGPHFARNFAFSGSPLGYDAPFDDGRFRWRNENPGWRVTVSDVLRHVSEQLGSGNPRWNRGEYDLVLRAHNWLKLDPQGEGSPPWSRFTELACLAPQGAGMVRILLRSEWGIPAVLLVPAMATLFGPVIPAPVRSRYAIERRFAEPDQTGVSRSRSLPIVARRCAPPRSRELDPSSARSSQPVCYIAQRGVFPGSAHPRSGGIVSRGRGRRGEVRMPRGRNRYRRESARIPFPGTAVAARFHRPVRARGCHQFHASLRTPGRSGALCRLLFAMRRSTGEDG
jgi:hypothetical protein